MENQFNTDEQLRNALRDFEAVPDSGSFDAILEKMNRKKKRRIFVIFFWTGLIALSGIMVPLIFNFRETAKPSANHTSQTQAVSLAQEETSTHNTPHPAITTPDSRTSEASAPSTKTASSLHLPNPEASAAPAITAATQAPEAGITSASSRAKHHSGKTSAEELNKQGLAGNHPESNHKMKAASGLPEQTGTLHNSPLRSKQDKDSQAVSAETITSVMYMNMIQTRLPVDSNRQDISTSLKEPAYPALFIAPEKKNSFAFYLGAQASPQLSRSVFSRNAHRDPVYNESAENFPEAYLNAKKQQSQLRFNLPFGIKAGLQINKRYEVLAGFGVQSFTEREKLYAAGPSTVTSVIDPGIAYNTAANFSVPYKNQFHYLYYSLEANRLFQLSKAIGFKLGLGVSGNQLINSNYVFAVSPHTYGQTLRGREHLSPWLLITKVKAGLIFNANRRFQLHMSPGFFYSPTSVFKKEYVIRQKPYGVDLECLLLFRLFSR